MYIAYYDESGDDGYPKCSSPLFILSTILKRLSYKGFKTGGDNIKAYTLKSIEK